MIVPSTNVKTTITMYSVSINYYYPNIKVLFLCQQTTNAAYTSNKTLFESRRHQFFFGVFIS